MTLATPRPNFAPKDVATSRRLFDYWKAKIDALPPGEVGGAVDAGGHRIELEYGVTALHASQTWPRLVWVAGQDSFGPTTLLSGPTGLPIKPRYTRIIGVVAYLHGEDESMAEMMAIDFISMLHAEYGATVIIQGGGLMHEDDEQQDATWLRDGAAYRLSFGIMAPVAPIANYAGIHDVRLYKCDDTEVR